MKKGTAITFAVGVFTGLALCGPAAQAADYLAARPTTQTFYLDGGKIELTAYLIGGSTYVRLRDIGRAADFGVTYDSSTNSVYIDPNAHYQEEVTPPAQGFIRQASEEMVAAFKMFHDTWNSTAWITNWDNVDIYTIIDSADNGVIGNSSYDYVSTAINLVLEHPEYFHNYHLWEYEWDGSQTWKLPGQESTPMQRLLIAVPDGEPKEDTVSLTVKKLEAGTNKPLSGVTFKIESAADPSAFSVTRTTGADGTVTLTREADGLSAGQYKITEEAAPEGFTPQTESQVVTVLPGSSAASTFTFYNTSTATGAGDGSIRKMDADNPTVGIPGAIIRITSILLDDGGSFAGEYTTKNGGYILKEDLDFSKLPTGSYVAEEITPPEGYILSSDVSKVKQAFVWDGEHDVSLIFEPHPSDREAPAAHAGHREDHRAGWPYPGPLRRFRHHRPGCCAGGLLRHRHRGHGRVRPPRQGADHTGAGAGGVRNVSGILRQSAFCDIVSL